jgi:putative heme-binding domain-containing protein
MRFSVCAIVLCFASVCTAKESAKPKEKPAKRPAAFADSATPVERIKVAKGFQVELLYNVPKERYGSWVNLAVDPKGRLIASAEAGHLYRLTVRPKGEPGEPIVERIPVELGQAQGLLCAFGNLYVMVNGNREKYPNGFYRVRDTNHDDQYDSVELLRELDGQRDHGPHAILLAPDGKSFYLVCGNNTKLTEINRSRVPRIWDEDQLLPRLYGKGFMKGTPPPAGCIYHVDPNGKDWELVACGFRNTFDAAFNADGELFTYDADMEWDIGMPWYRPTRVCHVVSGADWGWRNGSAKFPVYYADTLPPAVNVGPGSPTGVTFGYGAKFPARYQNAFFMCDWTFGKMYATHLRPSGATFTGELEDFITAAPLPFTDVVINPIDRAMYFIVGGRNCQSGLYRVTYVGNESPAPAPKDSNSNELQSTRHMLESLHLGKHPDAVDKAWPFLDHPDRYIRGAARTAIEHQPLETWQLRALKENNPQSSLTALLALVRQFPRSFKPVDLDLDTPPPVFPANQAAYNPIMPEVLAALGRLQPADLSYPQRLDLLRLYGLTLYRLGPPDERTREHLIKYLDAMYPAKEREANVLLTEMLCYLQAPTVAEKGIKLLQAAHTQEEQLDIARSLRFLRVGWTVETRRELFQWLQHARAYRGGENFRLVIDEVKADALKGLSENDLHAINDLINAPEPKESTVLNQARPVVKKWTMTDVLPLLETKLKHRNFDHGKDMFAAANCFKCHRFDGDGGAVGPDLTALSGRFSARDILESVLEPSKVISDQYAAVNVITTSGKVITGRITNFSRTEMHINTNMLDPLAVEKVDRDNIDEIQTSKVSMMPSGLLDTLNETEILDLFAFLLSRGDRHHAMFDP